MYLDEELNDPAPLELTDKEVFTGLLTAPKTVFRFIHESRYDKYGSVLLGLAGISRMLDNAASRGMGDNMSLWGVLGICIVAGALLGWLSYYIYAALIGWTGKWIDGQGDSSEIFRIVTYALVPTILGLLLVIPQIAVAGNGLFQSEADLSDLDTFSTIVFYASVVLEVGLGIWTFVLIVIGVAEVQKFGYGKAVLNILLPVLVVGVPVLVLVLLLQS